MSHHPPTPLIPRPILILRKSAIPDKIPEPHVPPTYPDRVFTATTPPPSHTPAFPSPYHPCILSAYSHPTQTTALASQSPHPPAMVPRQPHWPTNEDHMTTQTQQLKKIYNYTSDQHKWNYHNSRCSHYLLTTRIQISSQLRKPSSSPNQKLPNYKTSPPCALVRDNITFTTTYIHSTIKHTSHNFKWSTYILTSLNTSL